MLRKWFAFFLSTINSNISESIELESGGGANPDGYSYSGLRSLFIYVFFKQYIVTVGQLHC